MAVALPRLGGLFTSPAKVAGLRASRGPPVYSWWEGGAARTVCLFAT